MEKPKPVKVNKVKKQKVKILLNKQKNKRCSKVLDTLERIYSGI